MNIDGRNNSISNDDNIFEQENLLYRLFPCSGEKSKSSEIIFSIQIIDEKWLYILR